MSDARAETSGRRVNPIACPNVAHEGLDGVPAAGNERQECGGVVGIEGRDLGVVRCRNEEAEPDGERDHTPANETNIPHAQALPGDAVGGRRRGRR